MKYLCGFRKRSSLGVFILFVYLLTQKSSYLLPLSAQSLGWVTDPTVNNEIIVSDSFSHDIVKAVSDDVNGMYILYTEQHNGGYILLQHIDAEGALTWSTPVTIGISFEWINAAQMIKDDTNGVFIVWQEKRDNSIQIYGQRVSLDGHGLWGNEGLRISINNSYNGRSPQIIGDGAGGVIVSWGYASTSGTEQVHVQKISSNGEFKWGADGVNLSRFIQGAVDTQLEPDGSGGAFILYRDQGHVPLWLERIYHDGSRAWDTRVQLSSLGASGITSEYQFVYDGKGNVIVVWRQEVEGSIRDVIQVVLGTGEKLLIGDYVIFTHPGKVIPLDATTLVVSNTKVDNWNLDIYTSSISYDSGVFSQSTLMPILVKEGYQGVTDVIEDGTGGVVVAWTDRNTLPESQNILDPNEQSEWDIYAQRIEANGNSMWNPAGLVISNAPLLQTGSLIEKMGDGFVFMWTDERNGNSRDDIYAQRVNLDGTLGPAATPTPTMTPTSTPTATPTNTPTPPPGWELPISYQGRGDAATQTEFSDAYWDYSTAYFDHYNEKKKFASFLGDVYTENIDLSSGCDPTSHCYDNHNGHDMTGTDSAVYSVDSGTVVYASGLQEDGVNCALESSYGCVVIAEYLPHNADGRVYVLYAHLSQIDVSEADMITNKTRLGTQGATGCKGCEEHLHMTTMQHIEQGVLTTNAQVKGSKKSLVGVMSRREWKSLLRQLPPIDRAMTPQESAEHIYSYYGGQDEKQYGWCRYYSPEESGRLFTFIDPFGWQAEDTDPWSFLEKKDAKQEDKQSEGNNGKKDAVYGCGITSPYLWKYSV